MDAPLTPNPADQAPRRMRISIPLIAGVVIILLVIAGLVALAMNRSKSLTATAILLPIELRDAQFLVRGDAGATAYRWGFWKFVPAGTNVSSATVQDGTGATIRRAPDGSTEVWVGDTRITSSFAPKAAATLTPDGSKVAYAELWSPITASSTSTTSLAVALQHDADHWRVVMLDVKTKQQSVIGQGVAPLFLDDTSLIRFTTHGIARMDLKTNTDRVIAPYAAASSLTTTALSPDRTLVLWSDLANRTATVARITGDTLTTVRTYTAINPIGVTLGATAIYWVQPSTEGTMVFKYPFAASAPIKMYSFPPSFPVISMTL